MAETKNTKSGFSAEERAAMKERARELKQNATKEAALADQLTKISEFEPDDRALAEKVQRIVTEAAPELDSKLWYGMPAYYRDGKNVLFFQPAQKFGSRYSTLGFNDPANLDDGNMWPAAYAITKIGAAEEKQIVALVRKALS
jgi:uncharacterized protein YdhG (YjbR/CyaY superfamily)